MNGRKAIYKIISCTGIAKYFAKIVDCTSGIRHVQQTTVITKYADIKNYDKRSVKISGL